MTSPATRRLRFLPGARGLPAAAMLALGLLCAPSGAGAIPVLVLDANNQLLGADGVEVDGALYDVRFVDGPCAAVFVTCAPSHFAFTTASAAEAAADALIAQVIAASTVYDDAPGLTNGCGPNPGVPCNMFTPYAVDATAVETVRAVNTASPSANFVDTTAVLLLGFDTATQPAPPNGTTVWAIWTGVPEPSTVALLGFGIAGLGGVAAWRRPAVRRGRHAGAVATV